MLSQTTVVANVPVVVAEQEAPEPIRVIKWIGGRYVTVELTPEQVEMSKRRAAYVQDFDPCGVA